MLEHVFLLVGYAWVAPLISAAGSYFSAKRSERYASGMSNTAYQRAMEDMRQAGLNPMLAFQQGGASTPSPTIPDMGRGAGELAYSARRMEKLERPRVRSEIEYNYAATSAQAASAEKAMQDAMLAAEHRKWVGPRAEAEIRNIDTAIDRDPRGGTMWGTVNKVFDGIMAGKPVTWFKGILDKMDQASRRWIVEGLRRRLDEVDASGTTAKAIRRHLKAYGVEVGSEGGDEE